MRASLLTAAIGGLGTEAQIAAVVITAVLLGIVLELVRRRRLVERYALLWMVLSVALLVLAIWTDLLEWGTELVGFQVPANLLFVAAFGVVFVLLLHFSVATSRLSDETKILAQEVARLDHEVRSVRTGAVDGDGAGAGRPAEPSAAGAEQAKREGPVAG